MEVISDAHNRALNDLIDIIGQRNLYRLRAQKAEQRLDELIAILTQQTMPTRQQMLRLLED